MSEQRTTDPRRRYVVMAGVGKMERTLQGGFTDREAAKRYMVDRRESDKAAGLRATCYWIKLLRQ